MSDYYSTPAGWYADPEQTATLRYWTGESWTEQRAPAPPPPPTTGLEIAGVIFALVFPLVGLMIGAALYDRDKQKGMGVVCLSLLVMTIAVGIVALNAS